MKLIDGHTEGELWIAVRQERLALERERISLARRMSEIADRITVLDKAEDILEGGL